MNNNTETVYFGGGCFWCIKAIFKRVNGVLEVTSGYSGGHTENPTYGDVCSGTTGHAEVLEVKYDTTQVSFKDLLEVFFTVHDSTTKDRQGNDIGSQYRSIILYTTKKQKEESEEYLKILPNAITEIGETLEKVRKHGLINILSWFSKKLEPPFSKPHRRSSGSAFGLASANFLPARDFCSC